VPYVVEQLGDTEGPIVAVTDYMKAVPDQIGRFVHRGVDGPFIPLGTDGFGFSDTRPALREHFEIDAPHVAVAVLDGLASQGVVGRDLVADAIKRFGVDPDRQDPREA
jgi:pyruvate dehydrogenase E1 component